MQRVVKALFSLLVLTVLVVPVQAQELKFAILDLEGALFNSARAEALNAEIQAETADDQARVRELAEQGEAINEQMTLDGATMSAEQRRRLSSELEQIAVQYQYLVEKLQTLVDERQQQFQEANLPALQQAVREILDEGGYDVVFSTDVVIHANVARDLDITPRVIERFNGM